MNKARAPNGVLTNKPIALRMLPEEIAKVSAMAARENRPMANMCRVLVLKAIAQLEQHKTA